MASSGNTTTVWHRLVNELAERALFAPGGQPRVGPRQRLFDPESGRVVGPFRRILTRKNGEPRDFLGPRVTEYLSSIALTKWIDRFDTPDAEAVAALEATRASLPTVVLLLELDYRVTVDLPKLFSSLRAQVGLEHDLAIRCRPQPAPDYLYEVERVFGAGCVVAADGTLAPCDVLVTLQSGAAPRPHGARVLVEALCNGAGLLSYGDEADITADGRLSRSWFKPDFSPHLAAREVLLGRMVAIDLRQSADPGALTQCLLHDTLPMRSILADLACGQGRDQVVHVPHVVALNTAPSGPPAPVLPPALPDVLPRVSVIIPTRNAWPLLSDCLASLTSTDWPQDRLEIIVVDNGSTEPDCLQGLAEAERAGQIKVVRDGGAFNYARLNNDAVRCSSGEVIVLLNNDTLARTPDWLKDLARHALPPGIGAVGPKLLYEDGSVQHAGLVMGMHGVAAHVHVGLGSEAGGYRDLANLTHEVSVVTGACLAVTRRAFDAVGGFNEDFPVAFNDVVLCADLRGRGYANLYLARPLFFHFESKTRGQNTTREKQLRELADATRARGLHNALFLNDPYYSPNLSLQAPYTTALVPRRRPIWEKVGPKAPHVLILADMGHSADGSVAAQAADFRARGFRVTLGGPNEGRSRQSGDGLHVTLADPATAAVWAYENRVDLILAHAQPFYALPLLLGSSIPVEAFLSAASAAESEDVETVFALSCCRRVHLRPVNTGAVRQS